MALIDSCPGPQGLGGLQATAQGRSQQYALGQIGECYRANQQTATISSQVVYAVDPGYTYLTGGPYYNPSMGGWNTGRYQQSEPAIQPIPDPRIAAEERFYEEERARQRLHRVEVTARAESLLLSALNPIQAKDFRTTREFTVISKDGKRTYRITYGIAGNVILIEKGKPVARYCIYPIGIPIEDVMLAQKLMLETDEESFIRIANRTPIRGLERVVLVAA